MNSNSFFVGQKFQEKEEILIFFREFCNINFQPFTILNSSEERIVFKCRHGRRRASKITGERPNQHYLFRGCNAQINVYRGKRTYWLVTKVDLQHNHEIGRAQYDLCCRRRKLEGKDYNLISNLILAKAKNCVIADVLRKKCDTFLMRKDIQNIRNKLFSLSSQEKGKELENFLIKLVEENGTCTISCDDDGTVKALFIASEIMINNLKKCQPTVLQIDVSFGFDTENYKLLGFCYYSFITTSSEFAALAFISKGTSEIIEECLMEFKKLYVNDPLAFFIHKNFAEISAIRHVFPSSLILLSEIDVLKHVKKLLSTAFACHSATKENIFQMFRKVLLSQTEEEYEEKKMDLLVIASEVKVSVGNNMYLSFNDEFNNSWHSCKEMWVHCYRKSLPFKGDSTTDRMERSFWTLKNYINATFHGVPIIELVNFVSNRLNSSISFTTQEVFKIMDENPKIKTCLDAATLRLNETGLRLFKKSLVSLWTFKSVKPKYEEGVLEAGNLYGTNINSCKCVFWKSYEAPCQHILLLRELLNIDLYSDDCFHERYILTENSDINSSLLGSSCVEDTAPGDMNETTDISSTFNENNDKIETLTYKEKFDMVSAITKGINEIVCSHSTWKFLEYVEVLKNIANLIRQGESLAVISQPLQSCKVRKPESPERISLGKGQNFMLKFKEKVKYKRRPKRKSKFK